MGPDCTFLTRPGHPDLFGAEQIAAFYRALWKGADERITLFGLGAEEGFILAEIGTEIRARMDMPDFGEVGLGAGDRIRMHSIVAYRLRGSTIAHIQGKKVLSRAIEKKSGMTPAE